MKIRCLIVDDEPLGRERVRRFAEVIPDLELCGECEDGRSAVDQIMRVEPDLVFLDIQMPDLDGFGVLQELKRLNVATLPSVIFVTAYNEFAIKAFEVHALDYLLKPIQEARFGEAVARARQQISAKPEPQLQERLAHLLNDLAPSRPRYLKRIEVRSANRSDYVDLTDTQFLQADGNYIEVHAGAKTHLARMTMAQLEAQLDPNEFLRISRSTIVRLEAVQSIRAQGHRDHLVILKTGDQLALTRALSELKERLQFPHSDD